MNKPGSGYIFGQGGELKKIIAAIAAKIQDSQKLESAVEDISNFNRNLAGFYELIQAHRYTLIPVIDSIEEDSDLVVVLKRNIAKVAGDYNRSNRSIKSLINELRGLSEHIDRILDEKGLEDFDELIKDDESLQSIVNVASSIVWDEDCYDWLWKFIPEGKEESFRTAIVNESSTKDMDDENKKIFFNCCLSVAIKMHDNKHEAYAEVLLSGLLGQEESTTNCKEILVTLSAILKYLLAKDGSHQSIESLISEYVGDTHFSLNKELR